MAVCNHNLPVFGCDPCRNQERLNTLVHAVNTLPRPTCQECGRVMMVEDYDERGMTISYICSAGFDHDGEPLCEGEAQVKVR